MRVTISIVYWAERQADESPADQDAALNATRELIEELVELIDARCADAGLDVAIEHTPAPPVAS
jgi:hypothetical protein